MKAVVIGQGYVGLPVAVRAAEVGYNVVGIDLDKARAGRLAAGDSFVEDITSERLKAVIDAGTYTASSDYADAADFDIAVVTVPTPLHEGLPDLSFIEASAQSLAEYLTPGATVVLESTTYPGTTEELFIPILEEGSGLKAGTDFSAGYSPERIDPGNPVYHLENTPKVISGIDETSLQKVSKFYGDLVEQVVPVTSPKEAELAKLLENTFRHVNIALVNEMAVFARGLGVDLHESINAADSKPFGYMKFTPGPGVGGHCLPIDPSYLSWQVKKELGRPFRFVELANDVNDHMPDYVVSRVADLLNDDAKAIRGSKITVVGLAYKKNTSDTRESPAARVVELLLDLGADLTVVEPMADVQSMFTDVKVADLEQGLVDDSDLIVVLTDHDELDYELLNQTTTPVFDTRRRATGDNVIYL